MRPIARLVRFVSPRPPLSCPPFFPHARTPRPTPTPPLCPIAPHPRPLPSLPRQSRALGCGFRKSRMDVACQPSQDWCNQALGDSQAQHLRGFMSFGDGDEDTGLSKQHEESRVLGYSPEQIFAVVAAVDLYEDFVPWCQRSVVLRRKGDETLDAELEIGFKLLVERYISHVELKRPTLIKTSVSQSSLFDYLINVWEFEPGPVPGSCKLHFFVDFQFRSPLYRQVASMFFNEVVSRLVNSFENRCNSVYGPGTQLLKNSYGNQAAA